ncbi:hypothetical protein FRC10_000300, partial [Ceratobasidium sp. 414]
MVGSHGASTGYLALIHYILNVSTVFPISEEEENALIERDEKVFARNDLRELSQCVDRLQGLLQLSRDNLPKITRDVDLRDSRWHPTRWQSIQSNGSLLDCDVQRLQGSHWNVFTGSIADYPLDLLSQTADIWSLGLPAGPPPTLSHNEGSMTAGPGISASSGAALPDAFWDSPDWIALLTSQATMPGDAASPWPASAANDTQTAVGSRSAAISSTESEVHPRRRSRLALRAA